MAILKITINEFINLPKGEYLLLDVRSPGEYNHAHIPAALSLPLFTDEERKVVGTAYKQESKEQAVKIGLSYFGPKMNLLIETVEKIMSVNNLGPANKKDFSIIVHCWRGGMRSAGVAWLLDLYGFKVSTIIGGYKAYRNFVLQQFELTYQFKVIGGYTGSGKTEIIDTIKQKGETIIDLEGLAKHKGSAFGNMAGIPQSSQEMFENLLATELYNNKDKNIWVEDESQRIGNLNIPTKLYNLKQASPVYFLDIPFEERLEYIVAGYGNAGKDKLVNAIIRIKKRLGGLDTKNAINYLLEDDIKGCFSILLKYYDKHYLKGLYNRDNINTLLTTIPCEKVDANSNTQSLLNIKSV